MKKCIDCGEGVSRRESSRCRPCADAFKSGRNHPGFKHGLAHSVFNITYKNMASRCFNKGNGSYKDYGGRGIKCTWNNFDEFRSDMHESYLEHVEEFGEKNTQIDRIDNSGNYSKENCRWATLKEQARNKRSNTFVVYGGETKCLAEWAEVFNLNYQSLQTRLHRGWSIEKALTTPVKR